MTSPSVVAARPAAAETEAGRNARDLLKALPWPAVRAAAALGSRARGLLLRAAFAAEGGDMRSATARRLLLESGGVAIGAWSYGGCFVPGAFPPGSRIGRYVSVAEGVHAFGRNHPLGSASLHPCFFNAACGIVAEDTVPFGPFVVESDAWLGFRTIFTPGCRRVGLGAVVAAGSVVTSDVPDFAIVAGAPARFVRFRIPESAQRAVRESRWWDADATDAAPIVAALNAEFGRGPGAAERNPPGAREPAGHDDSVAMNASVHGLATQSSARPAVRS